MDRINLKSTEIGVKVAIRLMSEDIQYMCVVLVYFLTLLMSIFESFMLDDKLVTL